VQIIFDDELLFVILHFCKRLNISQLLFYLVMDEKCYGQFILNFIN
jgi:hypothetical protein